LPPDEQVVVRAGVMSYEDVSNSVETESLEDSGYFGLSTQSLPDKTADEIMEASGLPHRKMRVSTIGRLRKAGFVVDHFDDDGHCLIMFDQLPSEAEYESLQAAFDAAIVSPRYR
jgi:hypothetical protein